MKQIRLKDKILKISACEYNHDSNEGFYDCPLLKSGFCHPVLIGNCGGSGTGPIETISSDCPLEECCERTIEIKGEYPLKARINGYDTYVLMGGLVAPIKWSKKLTTSELVDIVNFQIRRGGEGFMGCSEGGDEK